MKSIKAFTILLAFAAIISSCSSGSDMSTPEGVGNTVFEMVKNLNSGDKEAFLKYFMSSEEILELSKNKELVTEEKVREEMAAIPTDIWNERLTLAYDGVKTLGESIGINWDVIEFLKFKPEEKVLNGIEGIEGDVYFTHEGKKYEMIIEAVWIGEEYKLVSMKGPIED